MANVVLGSEMCEALCPPRYTQNSCETEIISEIGHYMQ